MSRKKSPHVAHPTTWFTTNPDDLRRLVASARQLARCLRLSAGLACDGEPEGERRDAWLDVFGGAGVALNEAMRNPALPPLGAPPPAMRGPYTAYPHLMALRAVLADLVRGGRVEKGEDGRVTVANMGSRRTGTALAAAGTIDILEAAADGLAEAVGPADSADGRGQTDTKTDKPKKRIRSFPRESALLELAEKIKAGRRAGVTDIEVARGFCEEDEKNATRMLRRLRDYPHLLK